MSTKVVQYVEQASARETDHVRVFLRDCKIDLAVGVYKQEIGRTQPVIINVEVEAALPHHYQDLAEDKLDRVIDYEPIYDFIQDELPKLGHIPLLETVAEQIIAFCFLDPRIQKVRVRLEKPAVFESAGAGVEVCRLRPKPAA